MAERDVLETLNKVALATAQTTIAAVESGRLKREDQEYVLTDTTILAPGALTAGRQKVIRKVWDALAANRIVEEIQKNFSEAIEICAQKLTTNRRDTPTVRGDLRYVLLAVVKKAADELAVEFVPEMIDRLLFEYEDGELEWTGTIWLSGVRVSEPIEIKQGFTLRPPIAEDFNSELPSDAFGFDLQSRFFNTPGAVLDLACKARERPELRQEVNALSLFRPGSIEILREDWKSNSIFPYQGGSSMPLTRSFLRSTALSYDLQREDGPSLAAFLGKLPRDFPTKPIGHHDNPRWLPLKNYFLALHTATDAPERITQAIVSLESALLSDEKQEVGFRLRLRTASLLRFAGLEPVQVYNDMGTAYGIRSKYSHGAEIKKPLLETAKSLYPRIMNYARLVVIKFIQFPEPTERKEILAKLDLSLLDDVARDKLGAKLSEGLWTHAGPRLGFTQGTEGGLRTAQT